MADTRISDLTQVSNLNNGDFVEVSQVNSSSQTGYTSMKANMTDIANKVNNSVEFTSELQTTAKKIIPAINEVNGKGLGDLSDVSVSGATQGQVLTKGASSWEASTLNIPTFIALSTSDFTWDNNSSSFVSNYVLSNYLGGKTFKGIVGYFTNGGGIIGFRIDGNNYIRVYGVVPSNPISVITSSYQFNAQIIAI